MSITEEIVSLRREIDLIDNEIISLIRSRRDASTQILMLKKDAGLPTLDGPRELLLFQKYATELGSVGRSIIGAILRWSYRPDTENKTPGD